ncbi:hypothetical protein [Reichenbachiella versicolor]|uniref:hypothetical protein n=1 Tax=Reichenbachiella versicolor TaxID=1821036 RepID=UPI000D6E05FB|nr:hypothetical protein [Reichenbachiella versicolor]
MTACARFGIPGPVYVGARLGYLFTDDDQSDSELILLPEVGASLGKIDVNLDYQVLNDINYMNLRVVYYIIGG